MSNETNKTKQSHVLSKLKSSPSLRSWKTTFNLLQTITKNVYNEIRYIPLGVRQTEIWKENEDFVKLFNKVQDRTLLAPNKLFTLYQFAKSICPLKGNIAELGVYKGGSARLLSELFSKQVSDKKIFLFDTFMGLPKHDELVDHHREGDLGDTSFENVKLFLKDFSNVYFHQGLFSETLSRIENELFCFVHIDVDLYSSIIECCSFFYPRLIKGGIIIFDDYGFISCPGAKKAVDEFFQDKPDSPVYLTTGQCLVLKT